MGTVKDLIEEKDALFSLKQEKIRQRSKLRDELSDKTREWIAQQAEMRAALVEKRKAEKKARELESERYKLQK